MMSNQENQLLDDEIYARLQNHLLLQIWRNSPDNMFILQPLEDDFSFVDANIAQRNSLELVSAVPRNMPLRQLLPQDLYNQVTANYYRCLREKEAIHYEEEENLTSHDGRTQYWSTILSPIPGKEGDIEYIFGISRNITRLKQAQQEAEAANEVKTAFLANMSHEMRTPLNGITGATELLRNSSNDEERRQLCDLIMNAAESLSRQTSDILEYARIDSGKVRLENAPFSVHKVCGDVAALLAAEIKRKEISFDFSIDDAIPEMVTGDGGRLKQILLNLLSNAVKFTHSGSVGLQVVLENRLGDDHQLRFAVRDTGIGIHTDDIPQLFRPFSQLDQSTTRRYGGAGLGLTICKDLVKAKKGDIRVHSEPGKGSTFEVLLNYPAAMPLKPRARPLLSELPSLEDDQIHLLLVEDNQANRLVTEKILSRAGVSISHAEHGQRAVDLCAEQAFDVILMDWHMPVMDGLRATHLIRRMGGYYESVPIIGLTASAMDQDRKQCLQAGMDDVIQKPIIPDKMLRTIQRLYRQNAARRGCSGTQESVE